MTFGDKLREIRKNKNLTQKELGEKIGKTGATICDWEKGKASPNIEDLVRLADVLQVTTDYMLGRITSWSPFMDFVNTYEEQRSHILYVTLIKKYTPSNMRQLDRLVAHLLMNQEKDSLLSEIFQSVGYRIDMFPPTLDEWEEPDFELTEQRELRLKRERATKKGERAEGRKR